MTQNWTFGRRMGVGFSAIVALALATGLIAIFALANVTSAKDRVIDVDARLLIDARTMSVEVLEKTGAARGFLLSGDETFLTQMNQSRQSFLLALENLHTRVHTDEGPRLVEEIERSEAEHQRQLDQVIALRRTGASSDAIARAFEQGPASVYQQLSGDVDTFIRHEESLLANAQQSANTTATQAIMLVVGMVVAAIIVASVLGLLLTRSLRRMIGTSVGEVQSSSAELQASANQQATGAKEQATAMNEITTTVTELLATSRQIAESAQRVAQIAEQTADAGRTGETTVADARESITDIQRQVDLIVKHMLELGEKSQRIGAVLDIVSELAEQTNILAINSTIEAAGAGEAGKRFAIVADEIRKLADRVSDSTKEIRSLIDVIRSAVNTTVMATEIGSKAVDQGAQQFIDVTRSFEEIAGLVGTTSEAAREIELSTKQQSTAVEQVNLAVASVAQATKETEASSSQTSQTASQLTALSKELKSLIEPEKTRAPERTRV